MTIASITVERPGDELVAGARSYVYRMLATAFSYPEQDLTEAIANGDWLRQLKMISQHLPFGLLAPDTLPGDCSAEYLQQFYVSTFEVGPGRPFCPLYEGSHRNGRMKIMEELVRFYEHFGLKIAAGDHPDHISAELEFMHYMAFKEAAAVAHQDAVSDIRLAQRDFLERHLCKWVPRLRRRLAGASDQPAFYTSAFEIADEFCRRDVAWLQQA
jgi:DMSO reductase family type II enzyme chaperone